MFDNVCRFLAEHFSADIASWLLGQPLTLTTLSPSELSLQPIRADALILLHSNDLVLHVEFQTAPEPTIPFRLLDYRLRVYRRFPQKQMRQVVVYLRPSQSALVYQSVFELPGTRHEFEVLRLWEQPVELFLRAPGLLPFAVLAHSANRVETLREVSRRIEVMADAEQRSDIAASASILAGLVLKKELIGQLLRQEIMQESVIYQEIKAEGWQAGRQEGLQEGRQEGLQEGRQEGLQEGRQRVAMNLLQVGMSAEQVARMTDLSIEQIRQIQQQS